MHITNSSINDIEIIFQLFDSAVAYQEKNGYELWPQFSRALIENEIEEKRNWKICDGDTIACVFSVLYNDPVIWGEKDSEPSVYLHRIATNPSYKGKGMIGFVKNWAIEHARQNHRKYLRMDTWGNNETIRNYYIKNGFNYIGQQHLVRAEGLPEHYGGSVLSLFENEV